VTNTMKTNSDRGAVGNGVFGTKQERCVSLGQCLGELRIKENFAEYANAIPLDVL